MITVSKTVDRVRSVRGFESLPLRSTGRFSHEQAESRAVQAPSGRLGIEVSQGQLGAFSESVVPPAFPPAAGC
jgi:hypothetical protein